MGRHIDQGLATFFCKEPGSKYCRFVGPHSLSHPLNAATVAQRQPRDSYIMDGLGMFQNTFFTKTRREFADA